MKQPFPQKDEAKKCKYAVFDIYQSELFCTLTAQPCRVAWWSGKCKYNP